MTADHAAIRARLDAVKSEPWEIIGGGEYLAGVGIVIDANEGIRSPDAEFIAHAPEDMRALLDDYDAVKREMESRELHHFEVETENEALLAVIDAAPHGDDCEGWTGEYPDARYRCTCWKSRVRSDAQEATS